MAAVTSTPLEHYSFERVAEGVHFGRARPEGTALSNTGLVDLGSSTLVFDTGLTLRAAREIRRMAELLSGRAPSLCVNSHWHLDHILGNQLLADGPIFATRRTVEILLEKQAELAHQLTPGSLEADLREIEGRHRTDATEAERAEYHAALRIHRALFEEAIDLQLTPPTQDFDGELRIPGDREATLLTFGAGHTDSDAVLFLGKERVLFAGDLIVEGTHPNLTSGDPEHWLTVLDRLEELGPERIVTGHGPLATAASLGTMRDYLSTVLELAQTAGDVEVPSRFRPLSGREQFAANVAYVRGRSSGAR